MVYTPDHCCDFVTKPVRYRRSRTLDGKLKNEKQELKNSLDCFTSSNYTLLATAGRNGSLQERSRRVKLTAFAILASRVVEDGIDKCRALSCGVSCYCR